MSKKYGIESGEKLRHFLDMSDYLLSSSYHMEVRDRGCEMARIISTGILRVGECMSESELEADGCVSHATFIFCLLNLIDTRTFSAPVCTHVYT